MFIKKGDVNSLITTTVSKTNIEKVEKISDTSGLVTTTVSTKIEEVENTL